MKLAEAIAMAGGGIAMDEAKSFLATLVGQIIAILRTFITWALSMFRRIVSFAGEHPEAFTLIVGNAIIWVS